MTLEMTLAPTSWSDRSDNIRNFDENELAGRQGVSADAFRNLNQHGRILLNVFRTSDLPARDRFIGFRPFAAVFEFSWRNDTRMSLAAKGFLGFFPEYLQTRSKNCAH